MNEENVEQQQPVIGDQSFPQPPVFEPEIRPKKPFIKIAVVGGCLVLVIIGGLLYSKKGFLQADRLRENSTQEEANGVTAPEQPNASGSPTTPNLEDAQVVQDLYAFKKGEDFSLWISKAGDSSKISSQNEFVEIFSFSPKAGIVAYAWGKLETNENNAHYVYPNKVVLYDIKSGKKTTILEMENKVRTNLDNTPTQIGSLAFSSDGKFLAIGTSETISIYSLETKKLEQVLTLDEAEQLAAGKNAIYGYGVSSFSPDNTKMLYSEGGYEGSSPLVMDLITKKSIALPEGYNGYGGAPIGWLDAEHLLGIKVTDDYNNQVLTTIDVLSNQEKEVKKLEGTSYGSTLVNGLVYLIISNYGQNDVSVAQTYQRLVIVNVKDFSLQSFDLPQSVQGDTQDRLQIVGKLIPLDDHQFLTDGLRGNDKDIYLFDTTTKTLQVVQRDAQLISRW